MTAKKPAKLLIQKKKSKYKYKTSWVYVTITALPNIPVGTIADFDASDEGLEYSFTGGVGTVLYVNKEDIDHLPEWIAYVKKTERDGLKEVPND